MEQVLNVWVTKYALTEGVYEVEAVICRDTEGNMVKTTGKYTQYFHGEGREWHRTFESAKNRAEEMRVKKIESLKKSIAKIERMKF